MEQEENQSLTEYASILWRRKWLFLLVSILTFALAIFIVVKIPPTYRSTGIIQVEQQEIPTQWVNSTISSAAADRIQTIEQLVMTTANLTNVIEKFHLFEEFKDSMDTDQMVALTRQNFLLEPVEARNRRGLSAFKLSYDDKSPEIALNVARELVSLYLNENLRSRKQSVVDTRRFLEAEANRIEIQLADIEERISQFKEIHQSALPEFQSINFQTYARVEQQIGEIDRTLRSLEERRIVLETSIDSATRLLRVGSENLGTAVSINPTAERLEEIRPQYLSLKTRYSDEHPDVIKLKREIESLESLETIEPTVENNVRQEDTASIRLKSDLKSVSIEQRSLRNRREDLIKKLDDLDKQINKTPEVEREYQSLIRDHENLQRKYNEIRDKQNSAQISESLEAEQKAERFTLIEPPRLARYPHSPNRKKLSALAVGLALVSGLGTVFGLELLDGKIRNIYSVTSITNVPVLATVGYIQGAEDRRRRRRRIIVFVLSVVLIIVGILYFLDKYELSYDDVVPEQLRTRVIDFISNIRILN